MVVVSATVNHAKLDISGFASSPPILTSPNLENMATAATPVMNRASMLAAQPKFLMIALFMASIMPRKCSWLTMLTATMMQRMMNGGKKVIGRSLIASFLLVSPIIYPPIFLRYRRNLPDGGRSAPC